MAKGLRKNFTAAAKSRGGTLIDMLKDKNSRVTIEIHLALEEFWHCIGLEDLHADIDKVFNDKNGSQKLQTIILISKYINNEKYQKKAEILFSKCKDSIKKNLNDSDNTIRNEIATLLGEFGAIIGNDKLWKDLEASKLPAARQKLLKGKLKDDVPAPSKVSKAIKIPINDDAPKKTIPFKSTREIAEAEPSDRGRAKPTKAGRTDKFTPASLFQETHMDKEDALAKLAEGGLDELMEKKLNGKGHEDRSVGLEAVFNLLKTSPSLSEEAIVVMKDKMKDFKEINPTINKKVFECLLDMGQAHRKIAEKFFIEKNCVVVLMLMAERIGDGKYSESILGNLKQMAEFQSKKRIIAHFLYILKAKPMQAKLAKELSGVFVGLLQEEENWFEVPVLELGEFVKSCAMNNNVGVKQLASEVYKELYGLTAGKVAKVQDILDIPDKQRRALELAIEDIRVDAEVEPARKSPAPQKRVVGGGPKRLGVGAHGAHGGDSRASSKGSNKSDGSVGGRSQRSIGGLLTPSRGKRPVGRKTNVPQVEPQQQHHIAYDSENSIPNIQNGRAPNFPEGKLIITTQSRRARSTERWRCTGPTDKDLDTLYSHLRNHIAGPLLKKLYSVEATTFMEGLTILENILDNQ